MNKHWELYRIATILGCPQELTGKPLLLKTHIFWAQNKQKIKLILAWKFAPWWLIFIVPEGLSRLLGQKSPYRSNPAVISVIHNSKQSGKIYPLVQ